MSDVDSVVEVLSEKPFDMKKWIDESSNPLVIYLNNLGLPNQGVLVSNDERMKVFKNLDGVISELPIPLKSKSLYISKFVAACAAGLFDAALNFLWDETIENLREKVNRFDLEYFYSSITTDASRRSKLKTADDLVKVDDAELIQGCHHSGIISDIGYRHLDYIRGMRNWTSAAHPNQNDLSGLQLISWLETCLKEVIAKEPEGPAIEIRRLLINIRATTLAASDVPPIAANIARLPKELATSLLRTIFGMYTDTSMAAIAKNNIKLISKFVWKQSPDSTKYEIGLKYANFEANAEIPRRDAAHEFLGTVGGLSYLPINNISLKLEDKINNLMAAHFGWNNFHNEYSHAKELASYVPETGKIPIEVQYKYVKCLILCRIGNSSGVAWTAKDIYDKLIEKFQESEIQVTASLLGDAEIVSRVQSPQPATALIDIVKTLRTRTAHVIVQRVLDLVISSTPSVLGRSVLASGMKRALADLAS